MTDETSRPQDLMACIDLAASTRAEGKTVVTTNGGFDLLHPGHIFLLQEARKQGDVLIIGLNSDNYLRRTKGEDRPVDREDVRIRNVLEYADGAFVFDEDDPRQWLPLIVPNVHVNAATYGEECIEKPVLDDIGARLHLVEVKTELGSTTERIAKGS